LKKNPEKSNIQDFTRLVDLALVILANLFNLLMVGVFIARILKLGMIQAVAVIWIIFILILGTGFIYNIWANRERWKILIPWLFAIFLLLEVLLDYILQINFRNTFLLGPYLLLYYASILTMIGYSFLVKRIYGYITLVTYFLSQAAAVFSYIQVGHG
jgi:hypothetical protein